jgi:drug/metabolite transporter (DMT)-like permease
VTTTVRPTAAPGDDASRETPSRAPAMAVHAALFSAQAGFALFPILGKLALATLPAFVLAAIRVVAAALVLEGLRRAAGDREIERADRPAILLYALLGVSFNQVLFILGLSMTTAIHTSILTATIPLFTLGAAVALGREKMAARGAVGVLLATAGVLVLLDVTRFDLASGHLRGNLLILGNSLSYSFYLVLSRPILARYSARTVVSRVFLYGSGPILIVASPALLRFSPGGVTGGSWASLAGIVVFSTVLPYLWNSWALARTEASKVAFYVFLQPLIGSALAMLLLGETVGPRTAVATALIFAGLGIGVLPSRSIAAAEIR